VANVANTMPALGAVRRQPIAKKSASVRRRRIRQGVWLLLLGVMLALMFVWVRMQVVHLGYDVSRMIKATRDLSEQRNRLDAEVETLKTADRLSTIAVDRFGMRLPMSDEIVYVKRSDEVFSNNDQ
jgi:cell division protein FtsL